MEKAAETINSETHIFLYAKYWYKITDIIKDLKIIIGDYTGLDPEHVELIDIVKVLLIVTSNQMLNNPIVTDIDRDQLVRKFSDLIWDLHPENRWKVGGYKDESFEMGIIRKCLSILRLTSAKEIENLGKPDPNLLPLRTERKK